MKKIIIRILGGKGIGYGHYFRCLSLAKAIKLVDTSIDIIFLINEDLLEQIKSTDFKFIISNNLQEDINIIEKLDVDLFIFDSYLGNDKYLKQIKVKTKLMLIDDNNDIYDSSIPDTIYNGNIHAEKLKYPDVKGQIKLLGTKYLIMKEEYWVNDINKSVNKEGVLITTGGTDEYNIMLKILEEIIGLDIKIKVIIGPGYTDNYIKEIENMKTNNTELIYKPDSLKDYIALSKIVITAGGSTVYEVLLQNSIPIIFSMVNNQDLICKELNERGIEYIGKYPHIDYFKIKKLVKRKYNDRLLDGSISDIVDGKGCKLLAEEISRYIFK